MEIIGGILTMTMGFEQGRRSRYDLSMRGDPLMPGGDDKWGIWLFDFESTHLDETGPKGQQSQLVRLGRALSHRILENMLLIRPKR